MSAPPPGWYPTSSDDPFVRYWTGEHWSDQTVPPGATLPPPVPGTRIAGGSPRGTVARGTLTAVSVLLVLVLGNRLADLIAGLLPIAESSREMTGDWLGLIPAALVGAPLVARVGYRPVRMLLLLIPVYNVYFLYELVWRAAYLPFADWTPRPEHAPHWVQVPHPTRPGALLYVRRS
ncbi:DUF2510 domain-containing protein [Catellatospora sp. NPDC049609]|uniref:DUF2510 domain-containing protein n=1 Tax=Catellatospora sp. NPDC049609 TaxID=3155505 RepID=UPI0034432A58